MKILVTGGGGEEAVDQVRSLVNFSTGKTSAFLAEYFASKGHSVISLMGKRSICPKESENLKTERYISFSQLKEKLEMLCRKNRFDLVVHAAAVSDYSPDFIEVDGKNYSPGELNKIPSGSSLVIHMKKNPKLVDFIKEWNGTFSYLVAFKLTAGACSEERKEAVKKIFTALPDSKKTADAVISNDLSEIKGDLHKFEIYGKEMQILKKGENLNQMASSILELFSSSENLNF